MLVGLGISLGVSVAVLLPLGVVSARRHGGDLAEMSRVLPAMLGLLARLASDRDVPRGVRWRMGFAFAYNVQPFLNVIPDFIPVIGFSDNVVVTCWALRSALRIAGPDAVRRHWKGSPAALGQLFGALRIRGFSSGEAQDAQPTTAFR